MKQKKIHSILLFAFVVFSQKSLSQTRSASFEIADKRIVFEFRESNDLASNIYYPTFSGDSLNITVRPTHCFRHDTLVRINPVTKQEEFVEQIDSITITKFNLGSVSKTELFDAITTQFNVSKEGGNFRIRSLVFWVFNDKCSFLEVVYDKYESISSVKQSIGDIPIGSRLVIGDVVIGDITDANFYGHLWDLASLTLLD